ncbi:MAG: hypothetical protein DDT21_01209 [Syntrophomonadaceae bacterium]|nr:hypothetical protein [Bacillota bacterium]
MRCPLCVGTSLGKIGSGRYYCWNCLVELSGDEGSGLTAFYVDEEGALQALLPLDNRVRQEG